MSTLALLLPLCLAPQEPSDDAWTQRGGPTRDFRRPATVELTEHFGPWGPRKLWKRPLGDGYSALLFEDGRLFAQYREGEEEVLACLAAETGETRWSFRYEAPVYEEMDRGYGDGPNATPLLYEGRLFAASIDGQLHALDAATGALAWRLDLHERYGRQERREEYGFSASPIEVDGRLLLLVGGDPHGVVALDPEDGAHLWGSPPCGVSYAQGTVIELEEGPQLVFFSPTAAIGMDARTGAFRWHFPVENMFQNNLTPALHLGERRVWIASQLDGGSRVLRIPAADADPGTSPEVLWEKRAVQQAHWDSFREGDLVYGSLGGNMSSTLAGIHWKTGEVAWKYRGFHLAKGVLVGDRFYFLDENGQLGIAQFSPEGAEILDSRQLTERVSWTPPTLVGQVLYVRDRKHAMAVDLSPEAYEEPEED